MKSELEASKMLLATKNVQEIFIFFESIHYVAKSFELQKVNKSG